MNTRTCAVCSATKVIKKFGNGITCPKTTCLACKKKIAEFVETKTVMNIRRIVKGKIL